MKKLLFISCALLLIGCSNQKQYENTMKEYAIQFYNSYQSGQPGYTNPTISIKQLKEANELDDANFDLSKLDKCTDESYVELVLNEQNNEIEDIKYFLECK